MRYSQVGKAVGFGSTSIGSNPITSAHSYRIPNTGGLVNYTQAIGSTTLKELGKIHS